MSSARYLAEVMSQVTCVAPPRDDVDYIPAAQTPFNGKMWKRREALLATTIEAEIIPRLMLAHQQAPEQAKSRRRKRKGFVASEILEFARLVVVHDAAVASAYVDAVMRQGVTLEEIFINLFTPAAKHLGALWSEDKCTFSDVTIGLARIQQLVHGLSPFFDANAELRPLGRSALLAPLPGEQHSLGVLMVEEFFRRAGWDVWVPLGSSQSDLLQLVSQERFDVVGLSVSGQGLLDRIASGIQEIRKASANPAILVMVGGRFFNANPECVAHVGADVTDVDGSQAVVRLEGFSGHLRAG
jgi:MerR family transcriptional regulator, light-induced transcriptional regulator